MTPVYLSRQDKIDLLAYLIKAIRRSRSIALEITFVGTDGTRSTICVSKETRTSMQELDRVRKLT